GDVGRDVAEIAEGAGAGGYDAAGHLVVSCEAFLGGAVVVGADHAVVEVRHVNHVGVELLNPYFQGHCYRLSHRLGPSSYITLSAALASSKPAVDIITSRGTSISSR